MTRTVSKVSVLLITSSTLGLIFVGAAVGYTIWEATPKIAQLEADSKIQGWYGPAARNLARAAQGDLRAEILGLSLLGIPCVAGLVIGAVLRRRAVHDPDGARCRKCGYLLRGLTSDRCPECGLRTTLR